MNDTNTTQPISRDPYDLLLSGLDSLYVSYSLDGLGFNWEELQFQKERLQRERLDDFKEVKIGGLALALQPRGSYPYRYVLQGQHFEIRLAETMQPNCYVQFYSKGLWHEGIEKLAQTLHDWFTGLGAKPIRPEKISRADFAYDFHVPEVDFDKEWFLSRATVDAGWRRHGLVQTFQFGRGSIVVRIYDKAAEIEQESRKYWFYDLWGQKEHVWRVEFQVRGDRLKKGGIRTIDDLLSLKGDLVRELATHHTSLRLPGPDQNRSRWPLHPLWAALLEAIEREPQTGLIESIGPQNSLDYALRHQLRSIYGDLKGLAAVLSLVNQREGPMAMHSVLHRLSKLLKDTHHPELWQNDVKRKMAARRYGP